MIIFIKLLLLGSSSGKKARICIKKNQDQKKCHSTWTRVRCHMISLLPSVGCESCWQPAPACSEDSVKLAHCPPSLKHREKAVTLKVYPCSLLPVTKTQREGGNTKSLSLLTAPRHWNTERSGTLTVYPCSLPPVTETQREGGNTNSLSLLTASRHWNTERRR